ncbi:hypothetical protein [Mesorhizobium metallidurans]|uniref:hypothetical protein n=1 Tax=Mesorhizobium metallidurans TaxID=489722 RepID=UPI001427C49B|nr:hypothetical protein [Mesorhizobium metallidurans]
MIVSSAALAWTDINRPAATIPAETIFVIVEKLPLIFHAPKLVDCTAPLRCNPRANRRRQVENAEIFKRYQSVGTLAAEDERIPIEALLGKNCAVMPRFCPNPENAYLLGRPTPNTPKLVGTAVAVKR